MGLSKNCQSYVVRLPTREQQQGVQPVRRRNREQDRVPRLFSASSKLKLLRENHDYVANVRVVLQAMRIDGKKQNPSQTFRFREKSILNTLELYL